MSNWTNLTNGFLDMIQSFVKILLKWKYYFGGS